PQPRHSLLNCCTSSVNPPPGFRRDDEREALHSNLSAPLIPLLAAQRVANGAGPVRRRAAPAHPDLLGDPDRAQIRGIDIGRALRKSQCPETVAKNRGRGLRRIALPPGRAPETPADLDLRAFAIDRDEQNPAEEATRLLALAKGPIPEPGRIGPARAR